MIKKLIILDRDSEILAVTQGLQRRLWDTRCLHLDYNDADHWARCPSATPAARTRSRLWTNSRTLENWLHHFCLDKIRSVFSMSLFHRNQSPYGSGKACCSDTSASNAMETWVWLYGLVPVIVFIDSGTVLSVLKYDLFILLRSLTVLMARLAIALLPWQHEKNVLRYIKVWRYKSS